MTAVEETCNSKKVGGTDSTKDNSDSKGSDCPREFTDIVGSLGPWQIWILIYSIISGIPVGLNHLAVAFIAFDYDYWCSRPDDYNITVQEWWEKAIPNEVVGGVSQHSHCNMYDFNNLTNGNYSIIPCKTIEFAEENSHTIIKEWGMVCDQAWMVSMSQSIYMGGFFAAVILSGQLADILGRHPVIMINTVLLILAGTATAFASSYIMFVIFRFFVAMGQSGLSLTLFVLGIEIVGSEQRGTYTYIQGFGWHFGYCLLPLLGYYIRNWRTLQLAITLPCIIYLSFYWLIPESPRWLLANGKLDKAIVVLKKAAKANKKEVPDLERLAKKLCFAAEEEGKSKPIVTVLDLLRTPNLRKKTLNLYFSWVVIAFVYYGISLNTGDLGGDFYLNFFIAGAVEIPSTIACIIITKKFGRRIPFIITMFCCGLSFIGIIFVPQDSQWLKITLAMIGKFLVASAFTIVYIYSAELYPTVARNVGVGSSSTMARIGSILAPFMKELGKVTHVGVPMALFGGLSIASGCLLWFLPETQGFPVPETIEQAEAFGKKKKKTEYELEAVPNESQ